MLVYWTLFIYTTFVSWLCMRINKERKYSKELVQKYDVITRQVGIIGALFSLALLIFFASTRGYMADTSAYIANFKDTSSNLYDIPDIWSSGQKGPLYFTMTVIFKHFFGNSFTGWFTILALFQGFAIAKFLSNYSKNFTFSCYLLIANGTFIWMMNGVRQFTAVCILLLASKFLFNKKLLPYLICVLIAFFFHDTAIICIPFFFIFQGKPFNKKVILAIIMAVLAVIFVDEFTNLLDRALENTNHSEATSQFAYDDGVNIVTTILFAIPVVIAFWKRNIIESTDRPRHIDVLINMSCCTMAISLIGNFTSGILIGRLPIYFYIGNYVLLPWLIENCFTGNDKTFMKTSCYIGYFCYFLYYTNGLDYQSIIRAFNIYLHS